MQRAAAGRHPGSRSNPSAQDGMGKGVEVAARVGYAAKGVVYAVIGGLAVQQAIGRGGEITSTREALEEIASAPFGTILLGLVTAGLVGYVVWRLVEAVVDPEGDDGDDDGKRWLRRGFAVISAVAYGFLAYYGVTILMGSGGGGGSGGGSGGSGSMVGGLMTSTWGRWLVGAIGAGVVIRGGIQLVKAYTESFREKIRSFDFGPGTRTWVLRASRLGITARGIAFGLVGGSIINAAVTRNPNEAQGTEGVLQSLVGNPWLLGAMGLGLVFYGVYQWVKARYRIVGV